MKILDNAVLTEISKHYGTQPFTIIEIVWGNTLLYCDKVVPGVAGTIVSIDTLQSVLTLNNVETFSTSIVLDDVNGQLKNLLNVVDLHKIPCNIYQWYGDLGLDKKFLIFKGEIASPISWSETDRTVSFNITSNIESFETGFSPEEGQLDFVSPTDVGRAWPLGFGHVRYVPAVELKQVKETELLEPFGRVDPILPRKIQQIIDAYQAEYVFMVFANLNRAMLKYQVPPVWWVLREYVFCALNIDRLDAWKMATEIQLKQNRRRSRLQPGNAQLRRQVRLDAALLANIALFLVPFRTRLTWLQQKIEQIKYLWDLEKTLLRKMIEAQERMKQLAFEYYEADALLCDQKKFVKDEILVRDASIFPDQVDTDVTIDNLRYRVQFNHSTNIMKYVAGPIGLNVNKTLAVWQQDDEICHTQSGFTSLDLIWLQADPPPNLQGMYLLLKKAGGQPWVRHIVKVREQRGRKVYFDLVAWASVQTGGSNRKNSIENIIGQIVDAPFILGPMGQALPSSLFAGNLDPSIANRPEVQMLRNIVLLFPGGVSQETLRDLAELVFRLRFDKTGPIVLGKPDARSVYTIIGQDVEEITDVGGTILESWIQDYELLFEEIPDSLFYKVEAGTEVRETTDRCSTFIANILPSTIKAVHAYRTNTQGARFLAPVPSSYYVKNESASLGTYTVTSVTFPIRLGDIPGEGWEDQVYVTYNSSVGPNVVDVIQWLIETYTNKSVNEDNFAAMATTLDKYPVHFVRFNRANVLQELNRICWESRLALVLREDEFFLKYLSVEPEAVETLGISDIINKSIVVNYTETEEIVTKLTALYNEDYLPLEVDYKRPKIVLRHNLKKYGLREIDEEFGTFSQHENVLKSATFWLIRKSNTWKQITFRLPYKFLYLETHDTIEFDFGKDYITHADQTIKGTIISIVQEPATNTLNVTVELPIRIGEMTQYPFYWPADMTPAEWPTSDEQALGYAGGTDPGIGVTGVIDDCNPTEEELGF